MVRKYLLALAAAAILGAAAGVTAIPPRNAAAVTEIDVDIHPGTESTTGYLNCGWHSTCLSPYPLGRALDWRNSAGKKVYWRSDTYYSDSSSATVVAWNDYSASTAGCNTVTLLLRDLFGTTRGTVFYVHTDGAGADFDVYGHDSVKDQTTQVGTTTGSVDPGCSSTGPHLHQQAASPPDLYSSNFPTGVDMHEDDDPRGDVWASGNRMFHSSWTY